jgi:hypothetical protein
MNGSKLSLDEEREIETSAPEFYAACQRVRNGEQGALINAMDLMSTDTEWGTESVQAKQAKYLHSIVVELKAQGPEAFALVVSREPVKGDLLSGYMARDFHRKLRHSRPEERFTLDSIPKEDIEGEKVLFDPVVIGSGSPPIAMMGGFMKHTDIHAMSGHFITVDYDRDFLTAMADVRSHRPGVVYDLGSRTEVVQTKKGNVYPRPKRKGVR